MNLSRTGQWWRFNLFGICVQLTLTPGFICRAQTQPDQQTVQAVFQAIENNDTHALEEIYARNTNCVADDYYGAYNSRHYPLLQAAADGRTAIVALLLKYGASPNIAGDTRNSGNSQVTPLEVAAQHSHLEICEIVLKAGANPNHHSFSGETALHNAFSTFYGPHTNQNELAGMLLDYGANPFLEAGYYKHTPIQLAITQGDGKLVSRMLGLDKAHPLGAKSRQKESRSKRPSPGLNTAAETLSQHGNELLAAAAQRGEVEAVRSLLRAGVSAKSGNTNCPTLLQAFSLSSKEAAGARQSTIEQWRQAQARLKADYIPRANPEFVASLRSQEAGLAAKVEALDPERWQRTLDVLVEHGADYDVFAATALGDTNRIKGLMSTDNNIARIRDCNGQTPLHWAVQTDRLPLMTFWIGAGVPLETTNSAGQTALHLAATAGKADFATALLAAHAPTSIRDTNGWTPLDTAIQAKQSDCIHLLLPDTSAPAHPERGLAKTLHAAAAAGNIAGLAALLETETNLESRNELGLTPLQVAVQSGHLAAAALLVDKGADVNARDPEGNTLLLQTIPRYFGFFVRDRPPTNWFDRLGNDPRKETYRKYLTVGPYEQGPHAIMQTVCFLLACGIDVKATNHAGQTAMQLAADEKVTLFDDRERLIKMLGEVGGNVEQQDSKGNTVLHRAVTAVDANEVDRLAALLGAGANINATNAAGQTPLHVTANKIYGWDLNLPGTNEPFQMLVYRKADVNALDNQGRTPLHVLAAADTSFKQEATQLLLKAGANPNLQDHEGMTPLHALASSGQTFGAGTAQDLLAAGANPNIKDKHGRAPVHLFLMGSWPWSSAGEGIAALARAGADLSAKDGDGKTPLHYLAGLGSQSPLFFIRGIDGVFAGAKVDFQARDNNGDTPLHIAAKTGTSDVFNWLVKQGASLDVTNNRGETSRLLMAHSKDSFPRSGRANVETDIFQAVREGNVDAATRLLNADPQLVNQTNQFKETPLRVAAVQHRTNMVGFLETHGAKWDAGSAVLAARNDVLPSLLQRDPAAVATKVLGKGLVHIAAANGDLNTAKLLIAANCDLLAQDDWGLSPLGYALIMNSNEMQTLLLRHGARENLFDAVYANDLKGASVLLERDKSLASSLTSRRVSGVEIAAAAGHTNILKLLLKRGADMNAGGRAPIQLAAFHNQPQSLAVLIRAGARVNQADERGFAPLHWAAVGGATEAASLLLKNKADVNQAVAPAAQQQGQMGPDRGGLTGDTPLHLAALCGETNIVQLLLKSGANANALNAAQLTPLDLASSMPRPSFSLGMLHRSMTDLLEPLGVNKPLMSQPFNKLDRIRTAASLIRAAGGKPSLNSRPFGGQWPPP